VTRGNSRVAVVTACSVLTCATAAAGASAHPFSTWTGQAGPFRWQAKMIECGEVTGEPNRIEAHSRWINSPSNGYQRVIFRRQLRNTTARTWETVSSQTRSTKNSLEGHEFVLHWTQFFQAAPGEAGRRSRDVLHFAWRRDRSGPDRTVFAQHIVLGSCIVGA
jgi:hypothetical protein